MQPAQIKSYDFTKNVFELDLLTKNVKRLKTVEDLQNGILCQAP